MTDKFGSFTFLTGDMNYTDYGGKWYRKVAPGRYHVIELMNWADAVGENEAAEVGAKYNVALSEVDVFALARPNNEGVPPLCGALASCGYEINLSEGIVQKYDGAQVAPFGPVFELVCVEAAHGHGNKAPISDENGNNWRKLMRAAVSESRSLDDAAAHTEAMDRGVNAIGTSAKNYMLGNLFTKEFHQKRAEHK